MSYINHEVHGSPYMSVLTCDNADEIIIKKYSAGSAGRNNKFSFLVAIYFSGK